MKKQYYIEFTSLGKGSDNLIGNETVIEGNNGADALFRYYGKKFKRSAERNVEVVMTQCIIKDNRPYLCGNRCGYLLIRE